MVSVTPHRGEFINSTVLASSSPVWASPAKAYEDVCTLHGRYANILPLTKVDLVVSARCHLELEDVLPESVPGQEGSSPVLSRLWRRHVAVLHQVQLGAISRSKEVVAGPKRGWPT